MKLNILKSLSLLLLMSSTTFLQAQCIEKDGNVVQADGTPCSNTIITALPFLRIVPDARFGAMGDAGIALPADPNSIHFNASNLAFAEQDLSVSATYTPWLRALNLNDVFLAYLSAYKKLGDMQTLGMSMRYFSLGSIQFTNQDGMPLQEVRPNELELAFAYSRKLSKTFSAGLSAKYLYSNLGQGATSSTQVMTPAHGFAADLSFTYRQPVKIQDKKAFVTAALAFSNLGTKISYTKSANRDFIPANMGLGLGFSYEFDEFNKINIGIDINKLLVPTPIPRMIEENGVISQNPAWDEDNNGIADYKEKSVPSAIFSSFGDAAGGAKEEFNELMYSIGLEYWYNDIFAVRAGHYNEHKTKGNRKFFTVGLGLKYTIFNINFSYLIPSTSAQRNPLDNTLRFSLIFDFNDLGKKK